MNHEDVAFADATELAALLKRKAVSSVELTQLYLARLEKHGPSYGALVTLMPERALREAKRADRERARGAIRSPLHGVPYGVKDLLATVGAPTSWGAAPFRKQYFDFDATVVRKLTDAGAVLLAKLSMVELAGGFGYDDADASFTGPGRTPWNRDFWSGGSSSGPGAAVSAGLVGFAIGSETDGSIVTPAAFCGVTGLRPTYGRVSRHGAMALSWTMDKLGPLTRSARDAETVLRVMAGTDPQDPTTVERPYPAGRRRPRIAVLKDARKGAMPAVRANFDRSIGVLREFTDIVTDVAIPRLPWGATANAIINAECAAAFQDLIESGRSRELQSVDDRIGGYAQLAVSALDYINALRQRTLMMRAMHETFGQFDGVAWPTRETVSYPVGMPFGKAYTKFGGGASLTNQANLVGWPAIAIPNGFGDHHLPTSLSLMGAPFAEMAVTRIAARYQRLTDFHKRRPPVG